MDISDQYNKFYDINNPQIKNQSINKDNLQQIMQQQLNNSQKNQLLEYLLQNHLEEVEYIDFIKNMLCHQKYFQQFWNINVPSEIYSKIDIYTIKKNESFLKINKSRKNLYMILKGKAYMLQNGRQNCFQSFEEFQVEFQEEFNLKNYINKYKNMFHRCQLPGLNWEQLKTCLIKQTYSEDQMQIFYLLNNYYDQNIVKILQEGDYFNELFIDSIDRPTDQIIFCKEDCKFLGVSQQNFKKYLAKPLQDSKELILKILCNHNYLNDLTYSQKQILSDLSKFIHMKKNQFFKIHQYDEEFLFFIIQGSIQIIFNGKNLSTIQEKQFFGEEGQITRQSRDYQYKCIQDGILIKIKIKQILKSSKIPKQYRKKFFQRICQIAQEKIIMRDQIYNQNQKLFLDQQEKSEQVISPQQITSLLNPLICKVNQINQNQEEKQIQQQFFIKKILGGQTNLKLNISKFDFQTTAQFETEIKKSKILKYNKINKTFQSAQNYTKKLFFQKKQYNQQITHEQNSPKNSFKEQKTINCSIVDSQTTFCSYQDQSKNQSHDLKVLFLDQRCGSSISLKRCKTVKQLISQNKPVTYLEQIKDYLSQMNYQKQKKFLQNQQLNNNLLYQQNIKSGDKQ